jgi:nitrate reductase NapA
MKITRREFIRSTAVSVAAAAAGMAGAQSNVLTDRKDAGIKWHKAPCRFCGTGCGVTVAVKNDRVIATGGDPQAEVNKGLNCVKGYFLSKIMYGEDRLTRPLLRMKNGKFDKEGAFTAITWTRRSTSWRRKRKPRSRPRGRRRSACSARANGPSGKAMPPTSS